LTETVAIEAVAEVRQIKTMADFSVNLVLNLPEYCKEQAKQFIDWQGKTIKIVAIIDEKL
jgi:hypothetical protein